MQHEAGETVGTTQPAEENPDLKQTAASSKNKTIIFVKYVANVFWRLNWLETDGGGAISSSIGHADCPANGRRYTELC